MGHPNVSLYIPDARERSRIRRAAKRLGVSTTAFIRDAALARAVELEGKCPSCGAKHEARKSA